ncbi:MAG: extracellular solute-binding protein [Rubripirellula sp.]|nr:extracellular solute-binding protein [Rubripirellula sp.]
MIETFPYSTWIFRSAVRVRLLGFVGLASSLVLASGCVPRAESDVVVYSALDEEFAFPILNAFERSTDHATGVIPKFDVESTKTVGLVNRIIAEQDKPVCDLFWNNEIMHTVRLQKLGLLQTVNWDLPPGYPTDMVARDGTWCGFAARARVLLINTKLIPNPVDYPTSVADLSDPKWAKKCAMARPFFGTTATHFSVLRELQGREATLSQLQEIQQNAVILSGNKQVAQAVASGRVAWGLTDTDDAIIERDSGEPVAIIFPDQAPDQAGALRIPNTIAVLKNAPHSVAAAKLADYLISPETEDRLAMGNSSQLPVHRGSKFPPRVLPRDPVRWMRVDFESAAEGWDEWSKEVQSMFRD